MCSNQGKYRGIAGVNNLGEYWIYSVEWTNDRGSRTCPPDFHWFSVNGQEESYLILHYFSHSTMSVPRKSCGQCSSLMVTKESTNIVGGSRITDLGLCMVL